MNEQHHRHQRARGGRGLVAGHVDVQIQALLPHGALSGSKMRALHTHVVVLPQAAVVRELRASWTELGRIPDARKRRERVGVSKSVGLAVWHALERRQLTFRLQRRQRHSGKADAKDRQSATREAYLPARDVGAGVKRAQNAGAILCPSHVRLGCHPLRTEHGDHPQERQPTHGNCEQPGTR